MKLTTLAIGAASGYAVCRAIEATSVGLPLRTAFRLDNLLKPVSAVLKNLGGMSPATALAQANQPQVIDVTPVG